MSREIVKYVKFDKHNKKVYVTSACSNVRPRTYYTWEYTEASHIFSEHGIVEAKAKVLLSFESGDFYGTVFDKYLDILYYIYANEYKEYDWRKNEYTDEFNLKRKSKEFNDLLIKVIKHEKVPYNYLFYYMGNNKRLYGQIKYNSIRWITDIEKASTFISKQQVIDLLSCYNLSKTINIAMKKSNDNLIFCDEYKPE